MEAISFTVYGKAQPAGSKRAFARLAKDGRPFATVTDDNAKSRDWKNSVADAASQAYRGPLLTGPLRVRFDFYRPRPRGHFGSGKNSHLVKASAPAYPTSRPDVLKLARGVEDAISGVCWADDALIVDELLRKHWGEPARVEITIEQLTEVSS